MTPPPPELSAVRSLRVWALVLAAALGLMPGCAPKILDAPPAAPTAVTYNGPSYLHGTVGSLTRMRNHGPMPVSGYGVVVGLDGTGQRGAPPHLRQAIIQSLRKQDVGSVKTASLLRATPEQILDDMGTAVVAVEGLIPPGATQGTRFDVLVSKLPGTETTSLVGGRMIFRTDLAVLGTNAQGRYSAPLATSRGPLYTNPFDTRPATDGADDHRYTQAVIVGGGVVTEDRVIELVLNQPSASRARQIADQINARFPMSAQDPAEMAANPISNLVIRITIPMQWARDPDGFLNLAQRIYLGAPGFERSQAKRLYRELLDDPQTAQDVTWAWQALGRTIIPDLREHYGEPGRPDIQLAALDAGAFLGDERASAFLADLADSADPERRVQVARILGYLPDSIRGNRVLRQLIDDPQIPVRLAAYQTLSDTGSPLIERTPVFDGDQVKFLIDRVPAENPLVYVTYHGIPRVVLFGKQLGFTPDTLATLWDNRLMLRTPGSLAEAMIGLDPGGTLFVPVVGRGPIEPVDGVSWRSTITDPTGATAAIHIRSANLLEAFTRDLGAPSTQTQAVVVGRLVERFADVEPADGPDRTIELLALGDPEMVRPIVIYFQRPGQAAGRTYKITPTVATLAFMMAHKPTLDMPQAGLDLTYSDVVDALYQLCQTGDIPAPIEVDTTPLARLIAEQGDEKPVGRPETAPGSSPRATGPGSQFAPGSSPRPTDPEIAPGTSPAPGISPGTVPETTPETTPGITPESASGSASLRDGSVSAPGPDRPEAASPVSGRAESAP